MPNIDLSILNQRQTPAFYADVFANRPAAGYVGRIFVSTDTFAFYRDNGTGWDLIGGPGTGTVTGSGTAGQVTYWDGASSITGSNNLFWDSAAGHLGINTNTPGTGLDVHDTQSTVLQLNQLTATNDTRIAFQNAGTSLWRIGNFYNAGANDWGIYDVVGAAQRLTVKKTTGQVLIGTSTVGSGKLVVASASSDNGVQIVGASAPSLRIDSAESGPTKRAGLGISTATNNFIQGSADRDFCIFNGSTAAASPILFGVYDAGAVNVQEAARISAARNFLIGTTTDAGQKLQVSGAVKATNYFLDGMTAGSGALYYSGSRLTLANYNPNGTLSFEVNAGQTGLSIASDLSSTFYNSITATQGFFNSFGTYGNIRLASNPTGIEFYNTSGLVRNWQISAQSINDNALDFTPSTAAGGLTYSTPLLSLWGNISKVGIGTGTSTPQRVLQVNTTNTPPLRLQTSNGNTGIEFITSPTNYNWRIGGQLTVGDFFEITPSTTAGGTTFTTPAFGITSASNILIGTTTDNGAKLQVNGSITINNTVTAAVGIASTHKVSIIIGGVQYYLLASNI